MPDIKVIVDCSTGEVQEIELTAEEISERNSELALAEKQRAEQEALEAEKAAVKQSANDKLAALGLSAEEIAAITGA